MAAFPPPAKVLRIAVLVAVVLLIPLVVAVVVGGDTAILPAAMGLMAASVAPFCTPRQAVIFVGGLVVAGMLATAAVGSPVAVVALMVVTCLAAGLASRVSAGVFGVAPIAVAVLALNPQGATVLQTGVVMAAMGGFVVLVVHLAKVHVEVKPVPYAVALRHAIVMAGACGAATALALHYEWTRSYWLVMTLAIVLRPYAHESLLRNRDRVLGTVAGAVLAGMLSPLPRGWQMLLAAICMALMLSYVMLKNYLLQVTFMTPMTVFLVSSGSMNDTLAVDGQRLLYTVIACTAGGVLALLLARDTA